MAKTPPRRNESNANHSFGPQPANTFRRDLHPDLRADYVLANPPFNFLN